MSHCYPAAPPCGLHRETRQVWCFWAQVWWRFGFRAHCSRQVHLVPFSLCMVPNSWRAWLLISFQKLSKEMFWPLCTPICSRTLPRPSSFSTVCRQETASQSALLETLSGNSGERDLRHKALQQLWSRITEEDVTCFITVSMKEFYFIFFCFSCMLEHPSIHPSSSPYPFQGCGGAGAYPSCNVNSIFLTQYWL